MSWTDIFPVLSDGMLKKYGEGADAGERERMDEWFGVRRVVPSGREFSGGRRHVVSATVFWKMVLGSDPDLPAPTRERLVTAKRMGLVKRFAPWESYIEPLMEYTAGAVERHPDVEFRLYLAGDLEFLADDFARLGWEVHLMNSGSVRYCPGGFWRFLALEEPDALVTVIDSDRMREVDGEIARTRLMDEMGLGLWRVPGYYNGDNLHPDRPPAPVRDDAEPPDRKVCYRPILGGHFGGAGGIPVRELVEAFVWHSARGTMPVTADLPGRGPLPIHRVDWPDYGFDEWFLLAAIYPRMVGRGTLTFVPTDAQSLLLPVDIEYATWANPASEMVYFTP